MRARPATLGGVATVAASALITAAAALASHSYPATYTGSISGGGSVEFDVSTDGSTITRLVVDPGYTECGFTTLIVISNAGVVPIVDHAFSYMVPPWTFSGSFPTAQTAQGSTQYRRETFPACAISPRNWAATTPAPPTPTPTPSPTPTPPPDTTAPAIAVSGRTAQRAGRTVAVSVTSNEFGFANATGGVTVRRPRRTGTRFALRSAATQLAPNVTARLRLRVPSRARTAITKALRKGKRVRAVVTVSVRDPAGNSASAYRTVRLRRP